MAVQVFENTEFTTINATLTAILNITGIVQFTTNNLDLIFQRKLIAYNSVCFFDQGSGTERTLFNYVDINFVIEQPLNTTNQFTLNSSFPAGGVFNDFTNIVVLMGNQLTVSILPLPLKVVSLTLNLHDTAAINRRVVANLTLYWQTKKKAKFIGED